ncbi:hypothetical protein D3C78_543390 [compost metagenome]
MAAALPARYRLGSCQNTGIALMVPTRAITIAAITSAGITLVTPSMAAIAAIATAPTTTGTAKCQRTSLLRSERAPLRIIPAAPKT